MNRLLKQLAALVFVCLFATAMVTSCGQKPAEGDNSTETEAVKDTTEHPEGEHPSDTTEHPTDTTKSK